MRKPESFLYLSFLCLLITAASVEASGQQKPQPADVSSTCTRVNALYTIGQQIDFTRTFDDSVKRIAVLIRAADLLWPYQEDKSRAAFIEAFELASQDFKEKGDKPKRDGHLIVEVPDQRYSVISAVAKRDARWARKLSDQVLKEDSDAAKDKTSRDPEQDVRTAEKLLSTAYSLLGSDQRAALEVARTSLRYPATYWLSMFLYKLSELDRTAADIFYQDALSAYAAAPMERLLYLSLYPFGSSCDVGDMPLTTCYTVPAGFVPGIPLQHLLVETLLRRAQQVVGGIAEPSPNTGLSDGSQLWLAFTRMDGQVERSLPDLIGPLRQARGNLFATLNQEDQQRVTGATTPEPERSFDQFIEEAERQPDQQRREGTLVMAILRWGASENLDRITDVLAKIADSELRDKLLNWLYFDRTQKAIEERKLDVAKALAAKVIELDQRAYLYSKIAEESIKIIKNDAEARQLLEEVLTAASKAPDTSVKARALLGVAYLYTRIDPNRSIAALNDAVKCINRIEAPDFSSDDAGRRIEGKGFGAYAMMRTPGFSPENGFREIGKYDFDGALYLASNFANKPLRALTTLALVEQCLANQPSPKLKQKPVEPKP